MSAAAAHMKLAATQIKSSFLPQPFCCSSVLAILRPGTPGPPAILPHWPEAAASGNNRQKSKRELRHSVTVTSRSVPHPRLVPLVRAKRPTASLRAASQFLPGSSQIGGQRGSLGVPPSASRRRREPPQRRPSRGIAASRRTTVSPLPRRGLGHALRPHTDSKSHTTRPNSLV